MDPHLVLAYKLSTLRTRPIDAFFVTDLTEDEVQRIFRPWATWCRVHKLDDGERPGRGVLCLACSGRPPIPKEIGHHISRSFETVLDSSFDHMSERDHHLLQEISHHDFEIGGKNEWDGATVKHSVHILRLLSRTHCRDYFPIAVWPQLVQLRVVRGGGQLQALDVGCGPLTWLRYGALQKLLTVTGVDPLMELYEIVLSRHGLFDLDAIQPKHRLPIPFELLSSLAPELRDRFDLVWTNNALDHVERPDVCVEGMAFALRADGFAVIQVATNEGTRQNWQQLHRFDIDLDGDHVVATDRDGHRRRLVGPGCPLRLDKVLHYTASGLTVIARPIH
jgi:SAM-dependent methyltransferase